MLSPKEKNLEEHYSVFTALGMQPAVTVGEKSRRARICFACNGLLQFDGGRNLSIQAITD